MEGGQVKRIGTERQAENDNGVVVINDLEELRTVWKEIFVDAP